MTYHQLRTAACLFSLDMYKYYKKSFLDNVIDKIVWATCVLVIAAYVWPQLGMDASFGVFMAIGAIVSSAFWDVWGQSVKFVADITGDRIVDYYVTLPIPTWLYFATQVAFYTCRSIGPCLIIIPLSKLILWNQLDLAQVSWARCSLIIVLATLLCATLALIMASLVRDMDSVDSISVRFLLPMWFFGGSQFSWYTMYKAVPLFAWLNTANPLLYAMEGVHVAFLGQQGYLPFWLCCLMLVLFSIVFAYVGTRRLIKRLDCV